MNASIVKKEEFLEIVEQAHLAVFSDELNKNFFRFDFAIAVHEDSDPIGYTLVHELTSEDVEMTYGGVVQDHRNISSKEGFRLIIGRLKEMGYKNVLAQVENKNIPMLRLALSEDFLIIGNRTNKSGKQFMLLCKNLEG